MQVTINGERSRVDDGRTLAELIRSLGLDERRLAVERNRAIVPKSQYRSLRLEEGDVLEIVHFVGGG